MQPLRRHSYSRILAIGIIVFAAIALLALSSTSFPPVGLAVVGAGLVGLPSATVTAAAISDGTTVRPYAAPRSWAGRAYPKLIYFNELPRGRHFAAWEQPELFAAELRASFRSLREAQ